MDLSASSVWLTGEVDVGPRRGLGKLGNMSMGVMKKLGSVRCERALWAGMPEVGAKKTERELFAEMIVPTLCVGMPPVTLCVTS